MKHKIKLSENQFKRFIKESIKKIFEDYTVTTSNRNEEGFKNLETYNQAAQELEDTGSVKLAMIHNGVKTSGFIQDMENGEYQITIDDNIIICNNINDVFVQFKQYCLNKSNNINESLEQTYNYDSYSIIDNSDNANLGNYINIEDAIEDANNYALNNKYGSYDVVGYKEEINNGNKNIITKKLYTADKDNLY